LILLLLLLLKNLLITLALFMVLNLLVAPIRTLVLLLRIWGEEVLSLRGSICLDKRTQLTFHQILQLDNVRSLSLYMLETGLGKTIMHTTESQHFSEERVILIGKGLVSMQVLLGSKQHSVQRVHKQ
jgi:hypothetical protein